MKIKEIILPLRPRRLGGETIPGFTLLELMVVVCVIAILLMLLLPNLRRLRERARSTACQNNLHQYGIAMGHYMSNYKGYFIYPGDQTASADRQTKDFNASAYEAGIGWAPGGAGISITHDWTTFIAGYLPQLPKQDLFVNNSTNVGTLVSILPNVLSVKICPSVRLALSAEGNFFDPKSSSFKGYGEAAVYGETVDVADFEDGYDDDNNLILLTYFTTYAINTYSGVYLTDRKNISGNTVAFIDWNAKEGWCAGLTYTNWLFTTPVGRTPAHTTGDSKGTNWWRNEVGFHHGEGTNKYANYVAMDGHVSSVTSNQITLNYFTAAGP